MDGFAKVTITAYPFVVSYGEILVPAEIAGDETKIREYISDNFNSINFYSQDFDYCGTDIDIDF